MISTGAKKVGADVPNIFFMRFSVLKIEFLYEILCYLTVIFLKKIKSDLSHMKLNQCNHIIWRIFN